MGSSGGLNLDLTKLLLLRTLELMPALQTYIYRIYDARVQFDGERLRAGLEIYSRLVVEITAGKSVLTSQYVLKETMTY